MKICLTVLMGLPGSGKTTFAQTLQKEFKIYDEQHFNFIHVCYDELLPITAFEKLEEDFKWKVLRTKILNEIDLLLSSVKNDCLVTCPENFRTQLDKSSPDTILVVIIDDNMYLRSMRYALFRKAKQLNISFCQVYLKCPVGVSNDRNLSRPADKVIPFSVIAGMNERIEEPKSTNKWEKYSLVVDSYNNNYELYIEYFKMLKEALENPEHFESKENLAEKERDLLICMQNVLHQCDIALRQIISEKIQQYRAIRGPERNLKDYTAELTVKKRKIISEIKSGVIQVPNTVLTENGPITESEKKNLKLFIEEVFDN